MQNSSSSTSPSVRSCTWVVANPSTNKGWVENKLRPSIYSGGKDLGVLVDKFNTTQQCALAMKKILGCSKGIADRRSKVVILPLHSVPVRPYSWTTASSSENPNIRMWPCWRRATKMTRGLKHLSCEAPLQAQRFGVV